VRIISATHQNLEAHINKGKFRLDLYYRISEIVIDIPPLREREGDAIVIAIAFLKKYCVLHNKKIKNFTAEALAAIEAYLWPGNIRELENKIKRAVILSDDVNITSKDLEIEKNTNTTMYVNLKEVRESAEIIAIKNALIHSKNNISKTAKLLGVTRPTLYSLIEKYGILINE
jgi:two-component system NtrC family response regulator